MRGNSYVCTAFWIPLLVKATDVCRMITFATEDAWECSVIRRSILLECHPPASKQVAICMLDVTKPSLTLSSRIANGLTVQHKLKSRV